MTRMLQHYIAEKPDDPIGKFHIVNNSRVLFAFEGNIGLELLIQPMH